MKHLTLKHIALLSIVAIVISLTVLVTGIFIWFQTSRKYAIIERQPMDISVQTTENIRKEITLIDNSKVWLNSNSTLKYAADYREERRIHLKGEAYIKVRMQERLFTLDTDDITLFTYAASFLINNSPNKEIVHLILYSGELKLELPDLGKAITMRAGTALSWNKGTGEIELSQIKANIKGPEWIVHRFEYMTFDHILYTISQFYEVSVTNNRPDLNNEPFTLTFEGNMMLDEVMQIMKAVNNKFTYHIIDDSELVIN